jgi:hypothetical protein
MRKIFALLVPALLVLLGGCANDRSPVDTSTRLPPPNISCPSFPGELAIDVTGKLGPDFWECQAISATTHEALFEIYVGNHPFEPSGQLRFGGITRSNQNALVWFEMRDKGQRTWYTFIPYSNRGHAVTVVWFTTNDLAEFHRKADLVAQLREAP